MLALLQASRLWLLHVRGFDPDEFQHLHGAWLIHHGLLPYRDYFEHHTPWFHLLLAPFLSLFRVDSEPGSAVHFLFFARLLSWILAAGVLGLTYRLGRIWRGPAVGLIAAVLLAGTKIFSDKMLEVRPDTLSTLFWLGTLILSLQVMREGPTDRSRRRRRLLLSGICLGAAVMTSQKLLMAIPGLILSWILFFRAETAAGKPERGPAAGRNRGGSVLAGIMVLLGFAVPVLLTMGYFAARRGLGPFIENNFLLNAGWSARLDPRHIFGQFLKDSPAVAALGAGGMVLAGVEGRRRGALVSSGAPLAIQALGLILGLAVLPIAWPQYYLTFLPLLALLGAALLEAVWLRLPEWNHSWARDGSLAAFLVLVSLQPAFQTKSEFGWTNAGDLREIRYVLEHTGPSDTILDGWSGRGVFRPHAWYFFFLHNEVRAMLGPGEIDDLLQGLRAGRIKPTLVIFDAELQSLSPDVSHFLMQSYEPTGVGRICRRRGG